MSSLQNILEEKCSILLKEKEVFFAGLVTKNGKLACGGCKVGMKIVSDSQKEVMFMEHVLMSTMSRDFDDCLGRVRYTASKREKMTMISFPVGSFLFLAAVDPKEDIEKEAAKIQRIMKNFASCA